MKTLFFLNMIAYIWLTPFAHAEVYKWTDENGRVHYGDRPSEKQATRVDIQQHSPDQTKKAADWQTIQQRQKKYLEYLQDERQDRKQDQINLAEQNAKRKKMCNEASGYYRQLHTTPQWYREDEQGNKIYLDHKEKDQEIAKAKQYMEKYCAK